MDPKQTDPKTRADSLQSVVGHRWVVLIRGGPLRSPFEIAVVREDNTHGQLSYGWFDERKLLISHNGGPCSWPVTDAVWHRLVKVAEETAAELNAPEGEMPNE